MENAEHIAARVRSIASGHSDRPGALLPILHAVMMASASDLEDFARPGRQVVYAGAERLD